MANVKTPIGELLRKMKHDPESLTPAEFEAAKRLTRGQRRRSPTAGKADGPNVGATDRRRRVSEKYRRHFDTLALIYVRCGRNKAETARQVAAQLPHLGAFRPAALERWSDNPEWQAAVAAAEERASVDRELPPDARGAKLFVFAKDALRFLEQQYDDAKTDGDPKERKDLEARLLKIHEALRAEERHQSQLRTDAKLQSFRVFVRNLIAQLKGLPAEHELRLRDVLADPAKLMRTDVEH